MNFEELKIKKYSQEPTDSEHPQRFHHETILEAKRSDISAHLPFIEFIASMCNHCTEFGFRDGNSACALIAGCKGKVISYDHYPLEHSLNSEEINIFKSNKLPCKWQFIQGNTGDDNLIIELTDFLFIDTLHTYDHIKKELKQYTQVKKYIGFHDTCSQGKISIDSQGSKGIMPAIEEFLIEHPEWKQVYQVKFNHGLTLLKKK